jgi:hypothetical protein
MCSGTITSLNHKPPEREMSKLIATFRKMPSKANRDKLQQYLNKHGMAVCMASADELAFLKAHEFSI